MQSDEQILSLEFNKIKEDLILQHQVLGMEASGDWINSLEVEANRLNVKILGNAYTEQLVDGREPGEFPPIQAIEKWIEDKGIIANIEGEITVSSLAFLIARKIAREGTDYYKNGGTVLIENVITPKRIQEIINKVSQFNLSQIESEINSALRDVAQAVNT